MSAPNDFTIRSATEADVPTILAFIRLLAEYERLSHEVTATPEQLRTQLFGAKPAAEVVIACEAGRPVGFALYFTNFSTFLAKPGIYLEDVFVLLEARGKGYGRALLIHLARLAVERGCGRFEWAVLDWNQPPRSTSTAASAPNHSASGPGSGSREKRSPISRRATCSRAWARLV